MSKTVSLENLWFDGSFESTNYSESTFSVQQYADSHSGTHSLYTRYLGAGITQEDGSMISGHKYYFSYYCKALTIAGEIENSVYFYSSNELQQPSTNFYYNNVTVLNTWTRIGFLIKVPELTQVVNMTLFSGKDGMAQGGEYYFDDIVWVDLTKAFGTGKEPDVAWCNENIPFFETKLQLNIEVQEEESTKEKEKDSIDVYDSTYISLVKAPVIKPKFKIELLDFYENAIGEITKDIDVANSGSISINYQQGVRRSCTFTLSDTFGKYCPTSNENIFGFNTKFKVYIGLENIHTGKTYWFSQGIFYTTNPTSSRANSNQTVTINGVDKFGIFTSDTGYNQLEGTYVVPAGSKIYFVIKDILSLELGEGHMIDPKEPCIDNTLLDYELPYDIKKAPGSYMGDILIEIGNVLGADIYYDTNGVLTITSGTTDITYSQQSSIWDFSDVLPEYSNGSVSLNTIDAINIVKVVGNQVNNNEIYIGNAENHNPLSPTAIEKIGRKIYYEESANLPNQARADEYAKYVLNTKSIIQTAINFNSTLIPHLDVNKVITITDSYYEYNKERFIIQSITLPLDSKTLMSISCNNIASLPYYDLRNGG